MTSKTTNKYPRTARTCGSIGVEDEGDHSSCWTACQSISAKIGCSAHTLLNWVKKAGINAGKRTGLPSDISMRTKIRRCST